MKPQVKLFMSLILLTVLVAPTASAQDRLGAGIELIATHELAARLTVNGAEERITGRVSFHLATTTRDLEAGKITVRGFNVAFFGVPQKMLAGERYRGEPLGLLGFAVVTGKEQTLELDRQGRQVSGELEMFADASFLSAFAETPRDPKDPREHVFQTPVIPARGSVRITLAEPLSDAGEEPQRLSANLELRLHGEAFQSEDLYVAELEASTMERIQLSIESVRLWPYEFGRKLCVQPVFLWSLRWIFGRPIVQVSGQGLPFGQPGAETQWDKDDVIFDFRPPKYLTAGPYWEVDGTTEANALRALVDDDDCIEVFFVHAFDPACMWGMGATWGAGTASAQIVSSDGNARGGIDLTHLAHELGHVLGLLHPGDPAWPSAKAASTGTLMCPSGCLNDNPTVNSLENKVLLSNPLLEFTIKRRGHSPDCVDSADCGPCP